MSMCHVWVWHFPGVGRYLSTPLLTTPFVCIPMLKYGIPGSVFHEENYVKGYVIHCVAII